MPAVTTEQLDENIYFLLDNMNVAVMLFEGRPIGVTPPTFVELEGREKFSSGDSGGQGTILGSPAAGESDEEFLKGFILWLDRSLRERFVRHATILPAPIGRSTPSVRRWLPDHEARFPAEREPALDRVVHL